VRARNDERNIPDIHAGEVSMSFGNSDLFYSTRTVDPHVESSMNRAIEKKKKIIVEVAVML
jgi:hypothetical protein